ncbi:hypothetical protein [Flavisolibacter nicotianae]|uniref:hypothetical protein n=1 Tax=Flavisolibacter nicotianae TaxID=2364882 RepID=UPI0013C477D8|nr:hypothetical protein [Flavisolibacter nicotianae]
MSYTLEIILIIVLALALILFLIIRNKKDRRDLEQTLNKEVEGPEKHWSDEIID